MIKSNIKRLEYLCDIIPDLLKNIPEIDFTHKSSPDKWSKKEILGHLIDSATNNHQRLIRVQFEEVPTIVYDQNNWNTYNHYIHQNSSHLIEFWTIYNKHLIEIIRLLSTKDLERKCDIGKEVPVSLGWLINDYIRHLEHHLKQIVNYH